ncbi:hypothetical protein BCY91_06315 [Pelobium manganitolerans]|uniref:Uncharacterized protein n=2 Tax=Pelobium manganitolerans TaxID=1842495 RepID=A0A419S4T6_9SPHI|nr:hypothetical protein BCY91_06315 [Pelobium manganitolerans]
MFVCIIHCSAEFLIDKTHSISHRAEASIKDEGKKSHNEKQKGCGDDEDCSCCNQHGNYVVNENIKVNFEIKVPSAPELTYYFGNPTELYYRVVAINSSWPEIHGPPTISGKDISIKFRSLLI